MIRITVELISAIDPSRSRKLGEMTIANDGTGDQQTGNYNATLHGEYTGPGGRKCRVTQFNRRQQSVWSLVGAVLKGCGHTKHSPKLIEK